MSTGSKVLIALIGGIAVGAAIGILTAPAKGEETRKKVSDAARKASQKVKDGLKTVSDRKRTPETEEWI